MRNHTVMWKAEKILENPLATKVGEAWSDWRKIVIAKTQLQPPFQDKTEFQRLSSPRWSEERVNWVPNWGRWERLHIGPYSRRASQPDQGPRLGKWVAHRSSTDPGSLSSLFEGAEWAVGTPRSKLASRMGNILTKCSESAKQEISWAR